MVHLCKDWVKTKTPSEISSPLKKANKEESISILIDWAKQTGMNWRFFFSLRVRKPISNKKLSVERFEIRLIWFDLYFIFYRSYYWNSFFNKSHHKYWIMCWLPCSYYTRIFDVQRLVFSTLKIQCILDLHTVCIWI